jgi:hypothetical protein
MTGPLFRRLERKTGSTERAYEEIERAAELLGLRPACSPDEQLAGLALCSGGETLESVSRQMSWKDFEGLCSKVLRAKGYQVMEDIRFRRPRAQVDVFGVSTRISIAVDCKHWSRAPGYSELGRLVDLQKARARRLHETLDRTGPIAAVILTLLDQGARFVNGGAIVPIFTLRDFLDNIEAHEPYLDLV